MGVLGEVSVLGWRIGGGVGGLADRPFVVSPADQKQERVFLAEGG